MSHTTTVKGVAIRDVAALRQAVTELANSGLRVRLVENQTPRMYYNSQHGQCPFVLKLDDTIYDVGFDQGENGTLVPVFDAWGGHIQKVIGVKGDGPLAVIAKLLQGYTKHAAINNAVAQGYVIEDTFVDTEGNLQLVIAGM